MPGRARGSIINYAGAGLSLLLLSSAGVRAEIQINPQGWRFPNIVTSAKEMIRVSDRTPLIAGKETLLKGYRKMDGTHFMTFEIEGRVFGVLVDTDGKPPFEYSIMDTDGDGKFETKFNSRPESKDQGYVPQWIVDYYYTKHPDLKNPSAASKPVPPKLRSDPAPDAMPTPPPQPAKPSKEVLSQPNP
ncbi:MAG TPA: hypothetical protein VGV60_18000 [Candidatus Polarisedimenticolia bacterium]|jgi:hypothetical protein|nr:hypothetical protein [Candidatus Polarisedimenticolia bacterium]